MTPRDLERARAVRERIVADLGDRRGLSQEWEQIDDDVRAEIEGVWDGIIAAAIADEREANAKVCEGKRCEFGVIVPGSVPPRRIAPGEMDWNVALTEAASAIRARGGA
jgi:hypothetical protein